MKHWTSTGHDGKPAVTYRVYDSVSEWADSELQRFPKTYRKWHDKYLMVGCGFDIETTTVMNRSFMYHWQFSWNDSVITGRTWDDLAELFEVVQRYLDMKQSKIICWVANLAYEFSFIQHRFPISKVFARAERKPIKANLGRIEFRDCLYLSGQGGLKNLAKNYCKSAKMTGDIDHRQIRNSHTPLTELEWGYCVADVAILSEWSDYCFNRWCGKEKQNKIPLTATGIVRDSIRDSIGQDIDHVNQDCIARFPHTAENYDFWMKWLFRGGYTHANIFHVGDRLDNIIGADFTSSYPAVMLHCQYPVSCFLPTVLNTDGVRITDSQLDTDSVWLIARFHNIRTRTMHSIESGHKIIDGDGIKLDNGRLISAEFIEVAITDIDYRIYEMFYEWDSIEIKYAESAVSGRLPDYVLKPMMNAYSTKCKLKASGQDDTVEYKNAKSIVNSFYGCLVQRLNFDEITWNDSDGWDTVPTEKTYDSMVSKQILLPQWGIWVTAHARFALLSVLHQLDCSRNENNAVYCDTDSIYMIDTARNREIIDRYSAEMEIINRQFPPEFHDIGAFDWIDHGAHWQIKTLGAKRYLKYDPERNVIRVTVAGMKLGSYEGMLETDEPEDDSSILYGENKYISIDALFYDFRDKLLLDRTVSLKTTVRYHDKPYEEEINGELMQEMSGCCIVEIPFQVRMSELYIWAILDIHKDRRKPIVEENPDEYLYTII